MTDRANPEELEALFHDPAAPGGRLVQGIRGTACRNVRIALRHLGYRVAEGDSYDRQVADAVRQFQVDLRHVNQDGICGRRTWQLLVATLMQRGMAGAFGEMSRVGGEAGGRAVEQRAPRIFISYRRDDSAHPTARIYKALVDEVGRENVFKDVDSIAIGSHFPTVLAERLANCDVCLAVIGKGWLCERLKDPGDYVRREIEAALDRKVTTVPVLIAPAEMPSPFMWPPFVRALSNLQGRTLHADPDFDRCVSDLIKEIRELRGPGADRTEYRIGSPRRPFGSWS